MTVEGVAAIIAAMGVLWQIFSSISSNRPTASIEGDSLCIYNPKISVIFVSVKFVNVDKSESTADDRHIIVHNSEVDLDHIYTVYPRQNKKIKIYDVILNADSYKMDFKWKLFSDQYTLTVSPRVLS